MNDNLDNQNTNVANLTNERDKRTIFRVCKNKDNPYAQINKTCLNDPMISLKAKGLLSYLLSKPDDWVIHRSEVLKHCTDGKDSLQTAINELKEQGYLKIVTEKDSKGIIVGWSTNVFEVPQTTLALVQNTPEAENPLLGTNPESGNPDSGFPRSGKSATTNNNKTKNDNNFKKDNNKAKTMQEFKTEPNGSVVVGLMKMVEGWAISNALMQSWLKQHGEKYLTQKIELTKSSKAKNPAAYLNKAIALDWISPAPKEKEEDQDKPIETIFPTHEENIAWYSSLSSEKKKRFFEYAVAQHSCFDKLIELNGLDFTSDEFLKTTWFKMLMELTGRAKR